MKLRTMSIALVLLMVAVIAGAETPEQKGYRLIKMMDDAPWFQKVKSITYLNIYSSSGKLRFQKKLLMASLIQNMNKPNEIEHYYSRFLAPPDDRDNAYLARNFKNKPDEKFLYYRGIRKTKKVSGDTEKQSFFGSDFSNRDLGKPDFLLWNYRYMGTQKITMEIHVGGSVKRVPITAHIVRSLPKNEQIKRTTGYGKKLTYYYMKNGKPVLTPKIEFFDENQRKIKELTQLAFNNKYKNVLGEQVWYPMGIRMKNVRTGTYTELWFTNPKFESQATNVRMEIFNENKLHIKWNL